MTQSVFGDSFERLCMEAGKGETHDEHIQLIEQECRKVGDYTTMCTNCHQVATSAQAIVDGGYCSKCQGNSVSSALILAGII